MSYYEKYWELDSMKVFISWSGSKSERVAKILKKWIPCVIQRVEPYFSSADIDKGARWSTDIAKELQDALFGILCVTKENLNSSWLNFEAGALSKSIDQSKVCPFLVDLKPADITNSPILQFQMASSNKEEIHKLFSSINSNLCESALEETILNTSFDTFWDKMEQDLKAASIDSDTNEDETDTQTPIEEILELVRYQHKLLKSPTELFPPEYFFQIMRNSGNGVPRNVLLELEDYVNQMYRITHDNMDESMMLSNRPNESRLDIQYLSEIRALSESMMTLFKRIKRSSKMLY